MRTLLQLVAAALLVLSIDCAGATIVYTAVLNASSEIPPTASTGKGSAVITLDDAAHTLRVQIEFSGLTGTTTASHIHCCTAVALSGTAGVATTTPTFAGFPLGVTSGTYDQTLDLTQASSYNPAFVTANGGTLAGAEAALVQGMSNWKAYLNVHTTFAPGGEIRGFLSDRIFGNGFDSL
jgi:CHRD domain